MPTPGLSLLGFMDQQQAVNYLRGACVPPDPSDAALIAEWNAAQAKLGPSLDGAGNPDVQDLSSACQPHIQQLQQQDWWKAYLVAYPSATFKAVEIDPLLAFQFHIMNDRSDNHCNGLALGPGIADLLPVCLPLAPKPENFRVLNPRTRAAAKWSVAADRIICARCRYTERANGGARVVSSRQQSWIPVCVRASLCAGYSL